MRRLRRNRGERGQSVVEFAALVPIFLILFVIMYQLFGISFNSQYVHIKSRDKVMRSVDYDPCGQGALADGKEDAPAAVTQDLTFNSSSGGLGTATLDKTSKIRCN